MVFGGGTKGIDMDNSADYEKEKKQSDATLSEIEIYLKNGEIPIIKSPHKMFDECRHLRVSLDDEKREVRCHNCKKVLDPYWYLQLLATEWNIRRYHDSEAIKANKNLAQEQKNKEAKGKYFQRPENPDGANAWDAYIALMGNEPLYSYCHRGDWYISDGVCTMLDDYIYMELKRRKLKEAKK